MNDALLVPLLPKIGSRAKLIAKINEKKNEVQFKSKPVSSLSVRVSRKQKLEALSLSCFQC